MRRWCRGRHQRYLQNTPAKTPRQTQPSDPRPSRSCQRSAARRRGQCPKPRRIAIAVGAQRRGIDGAEHSAKIKRVMAGGSSDQGGGILATSTCAIVACVSGSNAARNRVRNRRALPAQILSGTRDVSDPLWNAPGVNLRGRVGGRSRLAHGTIRRLGRQKAPPPAVRRRCADALQGSGPQRVIAPPIAFSLAIVRCCRCSILLC